MKVVFSNLEFGNVAVADREKHFRIHLSPLKNQDFDEESLNLDLRMINYFD